MKEIDYKEIKNKTIIDTRLPDIFELGFIPGSVSLGYREKLFAERFQILFPDKNSEFLLISNEENKSNINEELSNLEYKNISFLKDGFKAYKDAGLPIDVVVSISTEEFELDLNWSEEFVLDVRQKKDFELEHIEGAINIPFQEINEKLNELPKDKPIYIHCSSGYSSMITSSILRKNRFNLVKNVYGGFKAIKETKVPIAKTKKK